LKTPSVDRSVVTPSSASVSTWYCCGWFWRRTRHVDGRCFYCNMDV